MRKPHARKLAVTAATNLASTGIPAFNVADSAICTGVGIIFVLCWWLRPEGPMAATAGAGR